MYRRHYFWKVMVIDAVITTLCCWLISNILEFYCSSSSNLLIIKGVWIFNNFGFLIFFVFLIPMFLAFKKNLTWPDQIFSIFSRGA